MSKRVLALKAGWTRDARGFDTASPPCPDEHLHTPSPIGYIARAEWAEQMSKTHNQWRCPTCHRWAIWEPVGSRGEAGRGQPAAQPR